MVAATHAWLLGAASVGGALDAIGRSFRSAGAMFLVTFWALVFGFVLSGAIQAFVRSGGIRGRLGDHGPAAVARATVLGALSSSCSYAAAAGAHALVRRGADTTSSMIYMFASTNLVIELGVALVALLGWSFLLAELVGALLMIMLLALVGGRLLPPLGVAAAEDEMHGGAATPPATAGDAARYTVGDLRMLWRELLLGFVLAGLLATVVPTAVWRDTLLTGHGALGAIENAVVAPAIALVSCVCSVGNVPLAAALWRGGASFGGVASFLFADLIAFPLLLVYRRLYGGRVTLRLLGVFWGVISLAGLATGALFSALGIVPHRRSTIAPGAYAFSPTTILDVLAAVLLIVVIVLAHRVGGAGTSNIDPVCKMVVDPEHPGAVAHHEGRRVIFCSSHCKERFLEEPARYLTEGASSDMAEMPRLECPRHIHTS